MPEVTKPERLDATTRMQSIRVQEAPPIVHPSLRTRVDDVKKMGDGCWREYRRDIERLIDDLLKATEEKQK